MDEVANIEEKHEAVIQATIEKKPSMADRFELAIPVILIMAFAYFGALALTQSQLAATATAAIVPLLFIFAILSNRKK